MVYPDKLKENIYASWITPITWEQQGKQEINQMLSQMPAKPAIAGSCTLLAEEGEPCRLTSQCYDLWRIQI